MALAQRLADDLKAAMRARDDLRVRTLRLVRAALVNAGKETGAEPTDDDALMVLRKQAKQRQESAEAYRAGGRDDLAATEEAELAIVQEYLPTGLSAEELRALAAAAIAQAGATEARQLGAVMRLLMPQVSGRADGAEVAAIVRELLG